MGVFDEVMEVCVHMHVNDDWGVVYDVVLKVLKIFYGVPQRLHASSEGLDFSLM